MKLAEILEQVFLECFHADYRTRLHHLALAGEPGLAPREEVQEQAEKVAALWKQVFE